VHATSNSWQTVQTKATTSLVSATTHNSNLKISQLNNYMQKVIGIGTQQSFSNQAMMIEGVQSVF